MATQEVRDNFVSVTTGWRIDIKNGKSYGICWAKFSPPHENLSITKGFPLTNPSRVRCAIYALTMGLEIVVTAPELEGLQAILITPSKIVYETFCKSPGIDNAAKWVNTSTGGKTNMFGYSKSYVGLMLDMIDALEKEAGEIVLLEDDPEVAKSNIFMRRMVNLDTLPDDEMPSAPKVGDTPAEQKSSAEKTVEARMGEIKTRNTILKELEQVSQDTRPSRPRRKFTRKEMQAASLSYFEQKIASDAKNKKKKEEAAATASVPPASLVPPAQPKPVAPEMVDLFKSTMKVAEAKPDDCWAHAAELAMK